MSVRILEDKQGQCALYDSVGGLSFGPVFEQREHAEAFLPWLRRKRTPPYAPIELLSFRARSWEKLYREFFEECVDGETGELKGAAV